MALPRGSLEEAIDLLSSHNVEIDIDDMRDRGAELDRRFLSYGTSNKARSTHCLSMTLVF